MKKDFFENFTLNPPAEEHTVRELALGNHVPIDYRNFLTEHNGGSGFIGDQHLVLFPAESLMKTNQDYQVNDFFPGIFLIGSNGSSEAIAVDNRKDESCYILIPFLFEEDAIIHLGDSLQEFFSTVYSKGFFG